LCQVDWQRHAYYKKDDGRIIITKRRKEKQRGEQGSRKKEEGCAQLRRTQVSGLSSVDKKTDDTH
jgi:hypothetical protein